ncbi:hypothetical protein [Halomonas sp. A020]|uniref:hypothetical protein n=1 Tax=Halomonas sp. A020 TaxID=2717374 RepID=UPI00248FEC89|nr:hypothetical protein [Halomonas sp. A020]
MAINLSAAKFFCWIKDHGYWVLAIAVVMIAMVAIGAYVWNFKELPISSDTGNWADFATYLSGTVGVAAVVATLAAFIITLKQQQKLIDSQEEQLAIAKRQLDMATDKRIVERAYEASLNVLPLVVNSLSNRSQRDFPNFSSNEHVEVWNCAQLFQRMNYSQVLAYPSTLTNAIKSEVINPNDVDFFVRDYFSEIDDICLMAFELIGADSNIYYIFDSNMKKGIGMDKDVWVFVRCYCSYKVGVGDIDFMKKASEYLRFELRQAGEEWLWFGLGEQVRESAGNIAW